MHGSVAGSKFRKCRVRKESSAQNRLRDGAKADPGQNIHHEGPKMRWAPYLSSGITGECAARLKGGRFSGKIGR